MEHGLRGDDAVADCPHRRLGPTRCVQLDQEPADQISRGMAGNAQAMADLLIGEAGREAVENLFFALLQEAILLALEIGERRAALARCFDADQSLGGKLRATAAVKLDVALVFPRMAGDRHGLGKGQWASAHEAEVSGCRRNGCVAGRHELLPDS